MRRTSMMLPEDLQRQAEALAAQRGISFGEFVRQSVVRETALSYDAGQDAFWDAPQLFHSGQSSGKGPGTGTLAERHDDELYGPIRTTPRKR